MTITDRRPKVIVPAAGVFGVESDTPELLPVTHISVENGVSLSSFLREYADKDDVWSHDFGKCEWI